MRLAERVAEIVCRWWTPRAHVERARELQQEEARRLDAAIRRLARDNPCAAAVIEIGRALRNGHELENPPARRREDADP